MKTASELVAKGVTVLDEHKPGWDERIDLKSLSIQTGTCCVLGQLYGGYTEGLAAIGLRSGREHGFALTPRHYLEVGVKWEDLDAAWADEIVSRRSDGLKTEEARELAVA